MALYDSTFEQDKAMADADTANLSFISKVRTASSTATSTKSDLLTQLNNLNLVKAKIDAAVAADSEDIEALARQAKVNKKIAETTANLAIADAWISGVNALPDV